MPLTPEAFVARYRTVTVNERAHLLTQQDPTRRVQSGPLKVGQEMTGRFLTLTGVYNLLTQYREMGQEPLTDIGSLNRAHTALDTAVAAAYGWSWPLPDVRRERQDAEAARQRDTEKAGKLARRQAEAGARAAQKKADREAQRASPRTGAARSEAEGQAGTPPEVGSTRT